MKKISYYLDESGNSGDLINQREDLSFGGQPIFTLSCVGINHLNKANQFINLLIDKYDIGNSELKSSELYYNKPEVFFDLAQYISNEQIPILVEVVDKKFCIAVHIVNHFIILHTQDEASGEPQVVRNHLADYLSTYLTDDCYFSFFRVCLDPTEQNLLSSMKRIKEFFEDRVEIYDAAKLIAMSIDETIDDFKILKEKLGSEAAIKEFIPIPDKTPTGLRINILPHIHSIFNVIARLNKYHSNNLDNIGLIHDNQNDFSEVLKYSKKFIESLNFHASDMPPTPHSDFNVRQSCSLEFIDSNRSSGIQIADLVAGFFNRYVNGLLYKDANINNIYHQIFQVFRCDFDPVDSLGVNFVIPQSKQQVIFQKFNM